MRNATTLSMVAGVITVAVLVAAVAATTVNGVNMAYAGGGGDKIKQTKVVVQTNAQMLTIRTSAHI